MNVTVAAEAGAVVARLACAAIAPLVWREDPADLASEWRAERSPFVERLIIKTCRQLQRLGLAPRDILRHDGGRATACIVDTVRVVRSGDAADAALKAVRLNAEWEAVVTHARSIAKAAEKRGRGGDRCNDLEGGSDDA